MISKLEVTTSTLPQNAIVPAATDPTRFGKAMPPNHEWLARGPVEDVLEPELEIVDTHHHLWVKPDNTYLFSDYLADVNSGHKIIASVYVDCHSMYRKDGPEELRPIGEVEFANGVAAMAASGSFGNTRVNAGIVGHADLTLGDRVAPVLEAQIAAGNGRFKGVRFTAAWDNDPVIGNSRKATGPGLYETDAFRAGFKQLTKLGLSLDAMLFHSQIGDTGALAKAEPDSNIILNHMGAPLGYGRYRGKEKEVFHHWKSNMQDLAQYPNISIKLGGVMMRLAAFDYGKAPVPASSELLASLWRPYIETCIELFGPERCMTESNFPVDKMGITYRGIWNTFKRIAAPMSDDEKKKIFSLTAKRVYRLSI